MYKGTIMFQPIINEKIYLHLISLATRRLTTTYEALAIEFHLPRSGNALGSTLSPILGSIFEFCVIANQPNLTSLVVRKSGVHKGIPGPGFWVMLGKESFFKDTDVEMLRRCTNEYQKEVYSYWRALISGPVRTEGMEELHKWSAQLTRLSSRIKVIVCVPLGVELPTTVGNVPIIPFEEINDATTGIGVWYDPMTIDLNDNAFYVNNGDAPARAPEKLNFLGDCRLVLHTDGRYYVARSKLANIRDGYRGIDKEDLADLIFE